MSKVSSAAAIVAAALLSASALPVSATSPAPSPTLQALVASTPGMPVTVRVAGEPCEFDLGCRVGVVITPVGSNTPALEGILDPAAGATTSEASLETSLAPGSYIASVTALGVTEATEEGEPAGAATTRVMGGCATTLELAPGQPTTQITAAMAWGQPACGIAIEPRAAAPRPGLARPIREDGPTPRFRPRGAPTVSTTKNGIRLELWVKDPTLRQGQWLLAHLRVSNVGDRAIRHTGKFEGLACPPIRSRADTSDLFDPGLAWTGVAATYKERFFRDGLLTRTGLSIPQYASPGGCADIGYAGSLEPGAVEDIPLAGLPNYWLRDQPLPPGIIHVTVGFEGSRRSDRVSVSTDVTLAGDPVAYPSPGQLVDAALSTPGFVETLERLPDPREWANTHVSFWRKPPYPLQPRLEGARDAPDGILEISQFLSGRDDSTPFVVTAVIDPWTAESYGASAFPGWVEPTSAAVGPAAASLTPSPSPSAERPTLAEVRRIAANVSDGSAGSGLTAVKEMGGVRVRLTLATNVLVAGEPAWLTTTVRNTGDAPISWTSDGCGISVLARGKVVGERWRRGLPPDVASIEADGRSRYYDLKWRAGKWSNASVREVYLQFEPDWAVGLGGFGCADVGIVNRIRPGEVVRQRMRWDGQVAGSLGLPPDGTARITGTFGFKPRGEDRRTVALHLEVPVGGGRDPDLLHPLEAVDAALADAAFRERVEPIKIGNRSEEYIAYDMPHDAWVVGVCGSFDGDRISWLAAIVDPATGEVTEIVDGPGGSTCDEGLPAPASTTDLASPAPEGP